MGSGVKMNLLKHFIKRDNYSRNKESPRYTIRNGKRYSRCCDAPLISKGGGDSTCSNCNNQITWGN